MDGSKVLRLLPPPVPLVALVLASAVPYVAGLGFYSDDWSFLSWMRTSPEQDVGSLLAVLDRNPNLHGRPVHMVQLVLLYKSFGLQPLGYHLVNTCTLAAAAALMYLVLARLSVPRAAAFPAALLWALSPSYSTDKYWFAAFGYTLVMAAYFLSLYAELRALTSGGRAADWRWKGLALGALLVCGFGHEVALPLLAADVLLLALLIHRGRVGSRQVRVRGLRGAATFLAPNLVALAAILAFKVSTAVGVGGGGGLLHRAASLTFSAVRVQAGSYGVALPSTTWWAVGQAGIGATAVAVAIGAVSTSYVWLLCRQEPAHRSTRRWLRLLTYGIAAAAIAYSIFLATSRISGTSTGLSNRVHIAGAVGVSLLVVGAAGAVASRVRSARLSRGLFTGAVGAVATCFALVSAAVAGYWTDAYRTELAVLGRVERALPAVPAGAAVILAGVCPYRGPAVVFESSWDLRGALAMHYDDPDLRANVVTSRLRVGETGLQATIYGESDGTYRYGDRLYLYDDRTGTVTVLHDLATARNVIGPVGGEVATGCPPAVEGWGVRVLPVERFGARGVLVPPPRD